MTGFFVHQQEDSKRDKITKEWKLVKKEKKNEIGNSVYFILTSNTITPKMYQLLHRVENEDRFA